MIKQKFQKLFRIYFPQTHGRIVRIQCIHEQIQYWQLQGC